MVQPSADGNRTSTRRIPKNDDGTPT